jgi:hypothetical protein
MNHPRRVLDPMKVNVRYTSPRGSAEDIYNVPSAAACGPQGGWDYDDPAHPPR